MAIDNDNHRRTMMLNGFLDIIAAAETDHSNQPRMIHWCGRAKIVLQRFDGPTHSFESVMSELEELEEVEEGVDEVEEVPSMISMFQGGSHQTVVNPYHSALFAEIHDAGASLLEDGNADVAASGSIPGWTFESLPAENNDTGGHEEKKESDDGDDYMPEESQYYMSPGGTFHEPDSENDIDQDEIEI